MLKKLGFIGAGKQAQAHAKAAVSLGAEVHKVFVKTNKSPNLEEFCKIANNKCEDLSGHWPSMLDADLDAIIVCAPWNVIPEMMPELLASPLPMLIEKPVMLGMKKEVWTNPGQNKYVAMNRRFYGAVAELKRMIEAAEVISVEAVWSDQVKELEDRHPGITPHLMEMYSIHMLDLLYYLFDSLRLAHAGPMPEGSVDAHFEAGSIFTPFPLHLSITQNNPQKSGITVRTKEHGCLVLSPLEELNVYRKMEILESEFGGRKYQPQYSMRHHEQTSGVKAGIMGQMDAFLNGDAEKLATIDDAIYIRNLINELRS